MLARRCQGAGCSRTEHHLIISFQEQGHRPGRNTTWSEFHQEGADDGARTGTNLNSVQKDPRPSNRGVFEAFLELETEAHGKVSACWKSRYGL